MPLQKLIIHELKKEQGSKEVEITISRKVIQLNVESQSLVKVLQESYAGDSIFFAGFKPGDHFFEKRYAQYVHSDRKDQSFIDFTKDCIDNLGTIIKTKPLATGGYLLFAEYTQEGIPYIGIFLLRDTQGKTIRRVPDSFEIHTIDLVDTGHLAMACRIDEQKSASGEPYYLSFTRKRQPEISDYFTDWIGISRLESSAQFTNALQQIINKLEPPVNPATNKPFRIDEVRQMVVDIARANARRNINIRTISAEVFGDPETIPSFAEKNRISIDSEFRYDKKALNKFLNIQVNKDDIFLRFPVGDFGTRVRFSEENPDIVIIESEKFAEALKEEVSDV